MDEEESLSRSSYFKTMKSYFWRFFIMKKLFLLIILAITMSFHVFAGEDSFFTTEASLGTGISIYDSSADDLRKALLGQSNYKRIVLGLTFDTNLNISDPLKIMFGTEAFSDFLWDKPSYFNTLDYAFFTGIKVFPNKSGLNFSISYVLGNRTDFFTELVEEPTEDLDEDGNTITTSVLKKHNNTKSWGNGFRLSIQYDFMQTKSYKVKPVVGGYYRYVPRGNYNTDHILCIYGGIRF